MRRILVVDTDSEQRHSMALGLRLADFAVFEATTYERAIETLASSNIDLIMIDLMIPGGQGLQLAREVRERFSLVDIVMTGGYSLSRGQLERAGLDPRAFVAKPYSMDDLSRFVDSRLRDVAPPALASC